MSHSSWYFTDYKIQWSKLDPKDLKGEVLAAIEDSKASLAQISNLPPEARNFQNVFMAFDKAGSWLSHTWNLAHSVSGFRDTQTLRDAITELTPIVDDYFSSIYLDEKLYSVIKEAASKDEDLNPVQKRYVEEVLNDFIFQGANLTGSDRAHYVELVKQLSLDTKQFRENILDARNSFEYYVKDISELKGLPERVITAAREAAVEKNHPDEWLFTLQPTFFSPVLEFAENEDFRKHIWTSYVNIGKGDHDTEALIWKIIRTRDEIARLLGFTTYPDRVACRRMVKTGKNIEDFITKFHDRVNDKFLEDVESLKQFKAKVTGQPCEEVFPWEAAYYSEKMRQELYDFNDEELRPYFKIENVLEGLNNILHHIYGIDIVEKPTYYIKEEFENQNQTSDQPIDTTGKVEVWNPDVKFFEVYDSKSHLLLGQFYADYFPNEKKRAGAWMDGFFTGNPKAGIPHVGYLCANLAKPIGGKPSLLELDEVATIFHETGHLMHHILSDVEIESLSGTNVPWDFVELPSQLLENWVWEKKAIDLFAKHFETNEPIPIELWNKKKAAKNFRSATFLMGQLRYGHLDVNLHLHFNELQPLGIDAATDQLLKTYRAPSSINRPSEARSFHHLFGSSMGYSSGYYSYLWAEVLDADVFTRFQKEGVLNEKTGAELRETIISKGNSQDPAQLFRNFMGRDPDQTALLIRYGLIENPDEL